MSIENLTHEMQRQTLGVMLDGTLKQLNKDRDATFLKILDLASACNMHCTGAASTDMESPESVDHLCDKCVPYASDWANEADALWASQTHKAQRYSNYAEK